MPLRKPPGATAYVYEKRLGSRVLPSLSSNRVWEDPGAQPSRPQAAETREMTYGIAQRPPRVRELRTYAHSATTRQ